VSALLALTDSAVQAVTYIVSSSVEASETARVAVSGAEGQQTLEIKEC
jgi:hypothetical protein